MTDENTDNVLWTFPNGFLFYFLLALRCLIPSCCVTTFCSECPYDLLQSLIGYSVSTLHKGCCQESSRRGIEGTERRDTPIPLCSFFDAPFLLFTISSLGGPSGCTGETIDPVCLPPAVEKRHRESSSLLTTSFD